MIYGPNPDDTHDNNPDLMQQIFAVTAGATLERLPVQYEVEINDATRVVIVKTYNAQLDDAEEIAEFVDRLTRRLWELREGDGE
jgi:hypothetical protein